MPYGTDSPEDVLTQILQSGAPGYYQGAAARPSTREQDIYQDQPVEDAIRRYAMGLDKTMPTAIPRQEEGLVGKIGTLLGLRSATVPVTPGIMGRAEQAKRGYDEAQIARRLGEMQAIGPQVLYGGGQFGAQAMEAVGEPGLAKAYKGFKGRGEVAEEGLAQKSDIAQQMMQVQQMRADAANLAAQASMMRAQGSVERANEMAGIAQQRLDLANQHEQLLQSRAQMEPLNRYVTAQTGFLERRMQALDTARANALPGQEASIDAQLSALQDESNQLNVEASQAKDLPDLLKRLSKPKATTAPAATGGYKPLAKGMFGGGKTAPKAAPAVPAPAATPSGPGFPLARPASEEMRAPAAAATTVAPVARPYPRMPFER